jgi:hypothetical protein
MVSLFHSGLIPGSHLKFPMTAAFYIISDSLFTIIIIITTTTLCHKVSAIGITFK